MHWLPLPPRKYSWYSFLLEAESTPGSQCGWKDYVMKNSSDTIGKKEYNIKNKTSETVTEFKYT